MMYASFFFLGVRAGAGRDEFEGPEIQALRRGDRVPGDAVQFIDEPATELVDLGERVDLAAVIRRLKLLPLTQAYLAWRKMPRTGLLGQFELMDEDVEAYTTIPDACTFAQDGIERFRIARIHYQDVANVGRESNAARSDDSRSERDAESGDNAFPDPDTRHPFAPLLHAGDSMRVHLALPSWDDRLSRHVRAAASSGLIGPQSKSVRSSHRVKNLPMDRAQKAMSGSWCHLSGGRAWHFSGGCSESSRARLGRRRAA